MGGVPSPLDYLLIAFGLAATVLVILVIYGNSLSNREDQLYLNSAEQAIMASEQQVLIAKMDRLKNVIVVLAVFAGCLALASAGVWVYTCLTR
ncbi:MAG: hypothetical protein ACRD3S_00115 [Terracidiphilus sp.]